MFLNILICDLSKTYPKLIQHLSENLSENLSKSYPRKTYIFRLIQKPIRGKLSFSDLSRNLSKTYREHEHIWNLTLFGCSGHERLPGSRVFAPSLHEQTSGFSGWGCSGRYGGLWPRSQACWILSPGGAGALGSVVEPGTLGPVVGPV